MPGRLTPGGMTGKERRAYWAAYKAQQGCTDCGCKDSDILEFDHLPGHEKLFTIGEAVMQTGYHSDADIVAEVAKCEVVCNPCHLKRTVSRRMADRYPREGDPG